MTTPHEDRRPPEEPRTEALETMPAEQEPATKPLEPLDDQPSRQQKAETGIPEPRVVREILPIYPRGRLRWLTVLLTFLLFLLALVVYGIPAMAYLGVPVQDALGSALGMVLRISSVAGIARLLLAPLVMVLAACCVGRYRVVTKVFALVVVLGAFGVGSLGSVLQMALMQSTLGYAGYDGLYAALNIVPGMVGTVLLLLGLLGLIAFRSQATYKRTTV